MSIENLMETIIREILTELREPKKSNKILFLERNSDNAKVQFNNLIGNWADIEFLGDGEDYDISKYKSILVSELSLDEFLNISEGKQINEKTNIIRRAFLENKEVIVVVEGLEHRRFANNSNNNFYSFLMEKEEVLNSFGVEFIKSSDLNERIQEIREIEHFNRDKTIENEERKNIKSYKIDEKLVTVSVLKDIITGTNTKEIQVSKDTIITSLAKDYIRENDLELRIES